MTPPYGEFVTVLGTADLFGANWLSDELQRRGIPTRRWVESRLGIRSPMPMNPGAGRDEFWIVEVPSDRLAEAQEVLTALAIEPLYGVATNPEEPHTAIFAWVPYAVGVFLVALAIMVVRSCTLVAS